jgi:hypothetical protein
MKKTLKKIAMILILVMLCNMFTGCGSIGGGLGGLAIGLLVLLGVGAVSFVVTMVRATGQAIEDTETLKKRGPRRTNPYIFENNALSTTVSSLSEGELSSLKETFLSFPENELNSFIGRLNSLSEQESVLLMDSINSFSVQELAAVVETFNSMSETEKISSIKSLNALPETASLANIVQNTKEEL